LEGVRNNDEILNELILMVDTLKNEHKNSIKEKESQDNETPLKTEMRKSKMDLKLGCLIEDLDFFRENKSILEGIPGSL